MNAGTYKVMVGSRGRGGREDHCKLWKVALWYLLERSEGKLCSIHSMYKLDSQEVQWCA